MNRDFTTGVTKFVRLVISSPDGRDIKVIKGGITKKTAKFEANKYPKECIKDIFDSDV